MPEGRSRYRPTSRPYAKRYHYVYRRHVFDKLRSLDLALTEFQQLLGSGEVIGEAYEDNLEIKELILVVEWLQPLHVVIAVDTVREEERLVTAYEPDPAQWTRDLRRRR